MIAQVIQRDLADASPFDAYICGPPPMCNSVSLILAAKGPKKGTRFSTASIRQSYSVATTTPRS